MEISIPDVGYRPGLDKTADCGVIPRPLEAPTDFAKLRLKSWHKQLIDKTSSSLADSVSLTAAASYSVEHL